MEHVFIIIYNFVAGRYLLLIARKGEWLFINATLQSLVESDLTVAWVPSSKTGSRCASRALWAAAAIGCATRIGRCLIFGFVSASCLLWLVQVLSLLLPRPPRWRAYRVAMKVRLLVGALQATAMRACAASLQRRWSDFYVRIFAIRFSDRITYRWGRMNTRRWIIW